jgi:plasmid segregation protein ParM
MLQQHKGHDNLSPTVAALDIGYGHTKAVYGARHLTFPSLVGPAVRVKFRNDLVGDGQGLTVTLNGQARFVGEYAARQSPFTISPRARDRDPELLQVLTLGACYRLGLSGRRLQLVTGLPVRWYTDREQLAETLIGTYHFTADGQPQHLEIVRVKVVPQPFGSLFRVLLSPQGVFLDEDRLANARVAVLDIGTHTTDYAYADQLRYVEPKSGSIPVAMARVYELLQRALEERYSAELDLPAVEEVARAGAITRFGERLDIGPLYKEGLTAVSGEILAQATTLWGAGQELAAVLLTGGGAIPFAEHVRQVFPHVRLVPQPQLSNALGFYRYGLRQFGA